MIARMLANTICCTNNQFDIRNILDIVATCHTDGVVVCRSKSAIGPMNAVF